MARQRIGTSNVSALVKSAQSAYQKTQDYNDQIAAYNFQMSDKSEADFNTYNSYLSKRAAQVTDPTKNLGFVKAQDSAFKGFKSAEIQRSSLAVNYGSASLYDKRDKLDQLWQQAMSIGDQSTAQSLELQRSSLDIQIQNEEAKAAAGSGSGRGGGGSGGYETQAGTNASKTFSDQTAIASHLKSQLAQGKISYSDFLSKMQYNQGILQDLSSKIQAEQEARKGGSSTGDPSVSGLSESDLNALQTHADTLFSSSEYKQFSPESLHRAGTYGQYDYGVHYNNGVAESVARPVESEFNNPDGSVGNVYQSGDKGGNSAWFNFRDAHGEPVPTKVDTFNHNADGSPTPYKSFMAPDGKGGFVQKIEMNVKTGRQDAQGNPEMKTIYVDPTKPGATKFLQDWAANNNSFTAAANNFGQIAGTAGNYVDPRPAAKMVADAVKKGIATLPGVDQALNGLQPELKKVADGANTGGIGGAFDVIKRDVGAWGHDLLKTNQGGNMFSNLGRNIPLVGNIGGAINNFLAGNTRKIQADNLRRAQEAAAAAEVQRQQRVAIQQAAAIRAAQSASAQVRSATPAVPANYTSGGNAVIRAAQAANPGAPVSTQPISQAQANAANTVANMGGYQTNMKPAPVKQNVFAKVGSWLGF